MSACPVRHMQGGVDRYLQHGVPPGGFLRALFSNDLIEAFRKADDENIAAMREWVTFMVNEMPWASQGSPEKVAAWIARHGTARQGAAA